MKSIYVNKAWKVIFSNIGAGEGDDNPDDKTKDTPVTFTQEQLDAKVAESLGGIKTKNAELLESVKEANAKLLKFDGVDIEGLTALQKTIENDEILSLAAAGKHTEAIDKATEKLRVTHSAEIDAATEEKTTLTQENVSLKSRLSNLQIGGKVTSAFITEKGHDTAMQDVVTRANSIFQLEDGSDDPIARDVDGKIIQGEKGPLTVQEWVISLKKTAPHLFPNSTSGDMTDNKDGKVPTDIEAQILAASKDGQHEKVRELRKLQTQKPSR
jgi:hypothetical protein